MAAMTYSGGSATLTGAGDPRVLSGVRVSAEFFDVMGVRPELGRSFRKEEDLPGQGQVVVLSHRLWSDRFGGDTRVIGRTVMLDERPFVVVGVMGAGFNFPSDPAIPSPDFWAPLAEPIQNYRGRHYLHVVARLKDGLSFEQAQADMARIARELSTELPDLNRGHDARVVALHDDLARGARPPLLLLLGAVSCLVLIGCSNVAGLLVANALGRGQEIAGRLALGASRFDVARQLMSESALLSVASAVLGLAGTHWLTRAMPALIPRELLALDVVPIDPTVLAFAVGAAVGTALLFGLAPVIQLRQVTLGAALRQETRSIATARSRLRGALVVGQIALTLVLVSSAGLMTRGLATLAAVDPGFVTSGVLVADIPLPAARYRNAARQGQFSSDIVDRASRLPGVVSAAVANAAPLSPALSTIAVDLDNRPTQPGQDQSARYRVVSADISERWDLPHSGRVFEAADARRAVPLIRWFPQQPLPANFDAPQPAPVAVINEAMARQFWPEGDPIGRRFRVLLSPWITVVGVVASTRTQSLSKQPVAEFYLHDLQEPQAGWSLLVRTTGDPSDAAPAIRQAIRNLDAQLAVSSMLTIDDLAGTAFRVPRFTSTIVGGFAGIALLLMIAGLYALIAFTTSQRLREIGVRLALGATRASVVGMVVRQAVLLSGLGVAAGVAASIPVARLVETQLFDVRAFDPLTWAGVTIVIALSMVAACWWPARRASRIDPALVLRE